MRTNKKLLSVILAASMVSSLLAPTAVQTSAANEGSTEAIETYALEEVQGGAILHCFDWSYNSIKAALPEIAAAGYTAVQTSPAQPPKDYSPTWTDTENQWWKLYQPLGFRVADGDTWFGTKEELTELCTEADRYGIKVIVDVVANHLANNGTSGGKYEYLHPDVDDIFKSQDYFHSVDTTSSNIRFNSTQHDIGMPDLNTANSFVQQKVLDYLKECVDCGVDGFRFDAAKHIELPTDEGFASDFWPTVINGINEYKDGLFIYGEILGDAGTSVSNYTKYMDLTDNYTGDHALERAYNGSAAGLAVSKYYKGTKADESVLWVESHDTYLGTAGSIIKNTADINSSTLVKTWAIVGARADSTSLYFARPNDEMGIPSTDTTWKSKAVSEINKFKNAFNGTSEYLSYSGNVAYIERGISGVVISNLDGQGAVTLQAARMMDGTYTDHITGNEFTVSSGVISGTVGDSGVAVVYNEDNITDSHITNQVLYLKPNTNWAKDSARFAMYVFGNDGNEWVDMTDSDGDGYYSAFVPSGIWTNVIFCRMNPATTTNSWDKGVKWNQTSDLFPDKNTNCYEITSTSEWNGDIGIWQNYTAANHSVTVSKEGSGTASASPSSAANGETISITAIPDNGFSFIGWGVISGGVILADSTLASTTFVMPDNDVEVKAVFEQNQYSVTVTNNGNGSASADPSVSASGQTITITAVPDNGFSFVGWEVISGGVELVDSTLASTTFVMPDNDVEVKAVFEQNHYSVTVTNEGNGSASADPSASVSGQTITITAVPDNGYSFTGWEVISGNVELSDSTSASTTFVMPGSDVEVKAVFEQIQDYSVTLLTEGSGTTLSSVQSAQQGQNVTISAAPGIGYRFKKWHVISGGITLADSFEDTTSFTMANSNVEIKAIFEKLDYTVNITAENCKVIVRTADSDNVGIYINDGDKVAYNTRLVYTAIANYGYYFGIDKNNGNKAIVEKTVELTVDGDVDISEMPSPKNYTLIATNSTGGEVPVIEGSNTVPYGTTVTVTAGQENDDYEFVGWYQSNGKLLSSEKNLSIVMTSNMTIKATYRKISGVVTFMANGQQQGNEFVYSGTPFSDDNFPKYVSARAGYEFKGWNMTADEINSELAAGNNVVVQAVFALASFNSDITVTINNGEKTTDDVFNYSKSTLLTITADDVDGKVFAYWLKDNAVFTYNNTLSYTVTADCSFRAVYTTASDIENNIKINTVNYIDGNLIIRTSADVPDNAAVTSAGVIVTNMSDNSSVTYQSNTADVSSEFVIAFNAQPGSVYSAKPFITYSLGGNDTTLDGEILQITAGEDYDENEKGTASILSYSYSSLTKKATFNSYLTVPENSVIVKAGLVAASSVSFDPTNDILTDKNADFVKSLAEAEGKCAPVNYTWNKTNVEAGDTWYARAYLVYTLDGVNHTVYGPLVKLTASA